MQPLPGLLPPARAQLHHVQLHLAGRCGNNEGLSGLEQRQHERLLHAGWRLGDRLACLPADLDHLIHQQ